MPFLPLFRLSLLPIIHFFGFFCLFLFLLLYSYCLMMAVNYGKLGGGGGGGAGGRLRRQSALSSLSKLFKPGLGEEEKKSIPFPAFFYGTCPIKAFTFGAQFYPCLNAVCTLYIFVMCIRNSATGTKKVTTANNNTLQPCWLSVMIKVRIFQTTP